MLINFVFLILLTSTIHSLRHEQRVMEVIARARKVDSTWKVRLSSFSNVMLSNEICINFNYCIISPEQTQFSMAQKKKEQRSF